MFEKEMNKIVLSGETYPIRCDMLVLEQIQDRFEDISEFENKLMGFKPLVNEDGSVKKDDEGRTVGISGTPDIKALKFALCSMVREGYAAEGKTKEVDETDLMRAVDMTPKELSEILHMEFMRCFKRKNPEPAQNTEKEHQNR